MDALPDQPGVRPPGAPHDGHPDDGALRAPRGVPLGQLLVERQLVTEEQLAVALAEQERTGKPLGRVLVDLELVNEATVAQALATQHGGVLKTEYGFATGFGGNGRAGPLPMLEPLVSPDDPAEALVDEGPKRPTIGAGLPLPPPPAPAPAAPAAVEELEPQAVVTELFEGGKDAGQPDPEPEQPPVALAAVEPVEEKDEEPLAPAVPTESEDVGDADPAPLAESGGAEASAELLARLAELEATLEVVRLAAETAAAARTEARDAAERAGRLEQELAAAGEARRAFQAEIDRLAAAAEEFAADRELQEKLVRARLVEIEQRLDAPQS